MSRELQDNGRQDFEIYQFDEAIFKGSEVCRNGWSNLNKKLKIYQIPSYDKSFICMSPISCFRGDIY